MRNKPVTNNPLEDKSEAVQALIIHTCYKKLLNEITNAPKFIDFVCYYDMCNFQLCNKGHGHELYNSISEKEPFENWYKRQLRDYGETPKYLQ